MKRSMRGWWMVMILIGPLWMGSNVSGLDSESVDWKWSNPAPHGHDIQDYFIEGGVGVQVGESGAFYWSTDQENWTQSETGTNKALRCVTWYNGSYFIGGEAGTILVTDDLVTFTAIDLGTEDWIEGITASASLIVAVGDNGAVFTSQDGSGWTQRSSGTTEWLRDIEFGGNRYVAVGENGTVISSFNGASWGPSASSTTFNLNSIINDGANRFVVAGDSGTLLTSSNGTTWSSVATGKQDDLITVTYGNGRFLAAGSNVALSVNSNGNVTDEALASASDKLPEYLWLSSAFESGVWYLGGSAGLVFRGALNAASSQIEWATPDNSLRNWIWDLEVVDDLAYAVGDFGTIMATEDGVNWDSRVVPSGATNRLVLTISGTSEGLVAAGSDGLVLYSPSETITSTEVRLVNGVQVEVESSVSVPGINWQQIEIPNITSDFKGSVHHDGQYFLCGEGGVMVRSSNGTDWTSIDSKISEFLSGLASDGEVLVAVGKNGSITRSVDGGDSWNPVTAFTANWLLQVRHLNGKFFACGQGGTIASSQDGITWTQAATPSSTALINDLMYSDGLYFAAGTLGRVWQSSDGDNWISLPVMTSKSFYTLAPIAGRLVVGGIEGAVLRTPLSPITTPIHIGSLQTLTLDNTTYLGFIIAGQTDQFFHLDVATQVQGIWEPVVTSGEIEASDGFETILYPVESEPETIFFRVSPADEP